VRFTRKHELIRFQPVAFEPHAVARAGRFDRLRPLPDDGRSRADRGGHGFDHLAESALQRAK
jgi:hypothetical protein